MGEDCITAEEIANLKVADLKRELKDRGLPTSGNKSELIDRLRNAILTNKDNLLDTTLMEEELLAEKPSVDSHSTESARHVVKVADELFSDSNTLIAEDILEETKPSMLVSSKAVIAAPAVSHDNEAASAKLALSNKERLEMRAKRFEIGAATSLETSQEEKLQARARKFGTNAGGATKLSSDVPPVDQTKLDARMKRFGIVKPEGSSTTSTPTVDVASKVDLDILKKRADRFGTSVSSIAKTLEEKERILKRTQRFGTTTLPTPAKKEKLVITT